ncbi:hypothetical protein MTL_21400 [Methylobacterium goesingense]|uniref:hypothetical protein n=1 Tax=Methylobacterium goesingense TaxID=243690 RepID=UPI000AFA1185|nr:hypothetical protein [Methylobacterium goesingense]MCI9882599.1 hypothetical protein [Methylobacterium goesingense]
MARSETDNVPEEENRFLLLVLFLILAAGVVFAEAAAMTRRGWIALSTWTPMRQS